MSIAALSTTESSGHTESSAWVSVGSLRDVIAHLCEGYEVQFAFGEARYRKGSPSTLKKQVADRYASLRCGMMALNLDLSCWLNSQYRRVSLDQAVTMMRRFGRRSNIHPRVLDVMIQAIALDYRQGMSVTISREMADISLIVSVTDRPPQHPPR